MILVDDGDHGAVRGLRQRPRAGIDCKREGIDDQHQQHRVARQSAQFLDAELKEIAEAHGQRACFFKSIAPAASSTGIMTASISRSSCSVANPNPLEKVPREIVTK